MFTGLIQEQGKVTKITRRGHTIELTCEASEHLLDNYQIGDSMAINGTCLTAIAINNRSFCVEMMPETYRRTTFSQMKVGDLVNLERALPYNGRLEGHLVTGHIDGTTHLVQKRIQENAFVFVFALPTTFRGEIISQGSVAINGVSLTVTATTEQTFSVSLIPHSKEQTNLGKLIQGQSVNIETDLLGKYVKAQGICKK
ncbi:riboflavin synthase [Candidatus Enterococcus courvalinii]|uniref:Riboflavin synthase n=1 Tax=Candidatus Enterococcus courvalinii TaxID=2815329 RepID=A0ABS3I3F7_9ENTE|nr:riboflavin synthase [Enterococcus sp. MSG2901]MBO0482712.1 riboflavin synthase [Enterococcus sp. MSG2901]